MTIMIKNNDNYDDKINTIMWYLIFSHGLVCTVLCVSLCSYMYVYYFTKLNKQTNN